MTTTPRLSPEASQGYRRVHFFKHFLTEEDWNARHHYHLEKFRLHNVYFHGYGIDEVERKLLVHQSQPASLQLEITPGLALDSEGNDIHVRQPETVQVELDKLNPPQTIYIKLVYQELATDRVRLADNHIENRYFRESYRIIVSQKPATGYQLELARVALSAQCSKIRNPLNPDQPGLDEIDMRFRRGLPCLINIDMATRLRLGNLLEERRKSLMRLGGNPKLASLALLSQGFSLLKELLDANCLKASTLEDILRFFSQLDHQVLELILSKFHPSLLDRPEWQKHLENCKAFRQLLDDKSRSIQQKLSMALIQLEKLSFSYAHIGRLLGNDNRIYLPGQSKPLPKQYPLSSNWDFVKTWSAEMPQVFDIDDLEWLRFGELNITDAASERQYKFRILESRDAWINRQRLYFPDGALIEDTGVAHEGGYSELVLSNVIPDTHLAIIRMMDYARADYELLINVNGQDVGISRCDGYDRRARWRNWPFVIPAYYVNSSVLTIRQTLLTADRDVNMFRFWFYQPMNW